ncbi:hypothetical protein CLOM_g13475 [Closterium sp. NIES-68]|nr:hypothetical protein CLOM_g13475 [Closterium sp. NIES-68]
MPREQSPAAVLRRDVRKRRTATAVISRLSATAVISRLSAIAVIATVPHRSVFSSLLLPLALLILAGASESARLVPPDSSAPSFETSQNQIPAGASESARFVPPATSAPSLARNILLPNEPLPSSSSSSSSSLSPSAESHDDVAESYDGVLVPRRMLFAPGWVLWRMANSYRCNPSSLKGYTSSRRLGNGLVLHWKATTGKRLRVAVVAKAGTEAAAAGWFAVGWSPKGRMDGSNVVSIESDNIPIAYDLSTYMDATEASAWGVTDASVTRTQRGTILRFTRTKGDGSSVGIRTWEGLNYIVFAYGMGNTIGEPQYSNTALIDFTCGCGLLRFRC